MTRETRAFAARAADAVDPAWPTSSRSRTVRTPIAGSMTLRDGGDVRTSFCGMEPGAFRAGRHRTVDRGARLAGHDERERPYAPDADGP
ncbi:hypothetical protein [Streptomyces sp. HYC2]|uniref:hypothetical protein n=1 Tax=Streptomyces sp. HYC2 TaxID=2955207 RepID=UPI002480B607|nr:hypothetical protein [Streptomyces sp. HYC2]